MVSSRLTDEELIELANSEVISEIDEVWDIRYYQERHNLRDGKYKIYTKHLYYHYSVWSVNPVSIELFLDLLQLSKKDKKILHIHRDSINIDLAKLIGDYVKKERVKKKEERFRKISSTKPKT